MAANHALTAANKSTLATIIALETNYSVNAKLNAWLQANEQSDSPDMTALATIAFASNQKTPILNFLGTY